MEPIILNEWMYDRGRGPELRSCRITVHDIFPYIREGFSDEEVLEYQPYVSPPELAALKQYIAEHYDAIAAHDAKIEERNARGIALQSTPEWNALFRGSNPLKQWYLKWQRYLWANPTAFESIDGESPEDYARRYLTSFAEWHRKTTTHEESRGAFK